MRTIWVFVVAASLLACKGGEHTVSQQRTVLRVCSDPNNLPFSNSRGEGFENKIAELVAHDMNADLQYTWWAQRRGFVRNTIKSGKCDLIVGVPTSFEMVRTTNPYYRSTYVFVTRKGDPVVRSFNDPGLRKMHIGVQLIGDDYANTPPVHALGNRHIVNNIKGYMVYGDYRTANPPARIVDAVANREVDVAVVWGPLAGYFAQDSPVPLNITPVSPQIDVPFLPFVYDISLGVKSGNDTLRLKLNDILKSRKADIDRILSSYGVPRVDVQIDSGGRA